MFHKLLLLPLLIATPLMAQQFGKPLTLREETKISDILAKGNALDGKLVQVHGKIIDVCPKKGCYIIIGGDQRHQSIMFKVEDGVIRFEPGIKGLDVVAEGTVFAPKVAVESCEDECASKAKGADKSDCDDKKDAPTQKIRIDGLGAVVKK